MGVVGPFANRPHLAITVLALIKNALIVGRQIESALLPVSVFNLGVDVCLVTTSYSKSFEFRYNECGGELFLTREADLSCKVNLGGFTITELPFAGSFYCGLANASHLNSLLIVLALRFRP